MEISLDNIWTFSTQMKPETYFAVPQIPDRERPREATYIPAGEVFY
jgi:hypothetical protein